MTRPEDVAATFCATLVDEWARAGVSDAVVAPGSRSTPLTLALLGGPIRTHLHHDERSASFMALGLAVASDRPVVVACTSGTAAAELHPAVVEAHHAGVPLLVVTTDRPPELRDVGAPQTIDQARLFGRATRWDTDPGVPDAATADRWRTLAARTVAEATGPDPGPVHLNLPFREPLLGVAGPLPAARAAGGAQVRVSRRYLLDDADADALAAAVAGRTGVLIAGGGVREPDGVHQLAAALGWPVLADPRSGCRSSSAAVVSHADALLRVPEFAAARRPQVVLRLGDPPASKVLAGWLAGLDAWQVAIHPRGRVVDPDGVVGTHLAAEPGAAAAAVAARVEVAVAAGVRDERDAWCAADAEASAAIGAGLAAHAGPTEPAVARAVLAAAPTGGAVVVGASMPVRDLEWYGLPRDDVQVVSNRGANGIDGVVSTAVGVALAGAPTVALMGDITFLHDQNGLIGLGRRAVDLVVVVVDNDGGGIFSFLPQARVLDGEVFERGWGTPHGVDLAGLAAAHQIPVDEPTTAADVDRSIRAAVAAGGVHVVRVRTDRTENVVLHDALHDAVRRSLR